MSTINAIMAELQAGEAAKQRVPELERTLADYTRKLDEAHQHNQNLELRAKAREETIVKQAETIAKLREERDDASFRVLETEERLNTFMDAVGNAFGGIGNALQAVKPQKPAEPEVKQEPITKPIFKPGDPLPGEQPNPLPATATGDAATGGASSSASAGQTDTGQRAPSPTVSPASPTTGGQSLSAEPSGAESIGAAASGHTSQSAPTVQAQNEWKPSIEMPEVKPEDPFAPASNASGPTPADTRGGASTGQDPAVYKPFSDPPKPDWNDKF